MGIKFTEIDLENIKTNNKMRKMKFAEIDIDFTVLDRFNSLTAYELAKLDNGKFTMIDLQTGQNLDLAVDFYTILDTWYIKAKYYFKEEYLENIGNDVNDMDRLRAETYLKELEIIKRGWLIQGGRTL